MYVVEVHDDLFVIDAGLMFPEDEMFGIDIVIPDYSYLVENKNRIRGIFLSHGHEDHIGAIPYILRQIDVPVYGTRLTLALTKIKLKEHGLSLKIDFREVKENTQLTFEHAKITFFHVNHSIPDAVGICIETSEGNIWIPEILNLIRVQIHYTVPILVRSEDRRSWCLMFIIR